MSSLIEELKKEHADILDILDQVTTLGISSGPGRDIMASEKIQTLTDTNFDVAVSGDTIVVGPRIF